MEKKFKCKDEVIYRSPDDNHEWIFGLFSHYGKDKDGIEYVIVNGAFYRLDDVYILPYEGNEHLVGTDLPAEEEVRLEEGEYCFFCSEVEQRADMWIFDKFKSLCGNQFYSIGSNWNYAIRFSDFNPNDMEETSRHILCVKNGRIIRYKG